MKEKALRHSFKAWSFCFEIEVGISWNIALLSLREVLNRKSMSREARMKVGIEVHFCAVNRIETTPRET